MKKLITTAALALFVFSSSVQGFFFGCGWYRGCCPSYNQGHAACCYEYESEYYPEYEYYYY